MYRISSVKKTKPKKITENKSDLKARNFLNTMKYNRMQKRVCLPTRVEHEIKVQTYHVLYLFV